MLLQAVMIIPKVPMIQNINHEELNRTYFQARTLVQIVFEALLYFVDDDQYFSVGGFLLKSPHMLVPYNGEQFHAKWAEQNGTKHKVAREYPELLHVKTGLRLRSRALKQFVTEIILDRLQRGTIEELQALDQAEGLTSPGQIYATDETPTEFLQLQNLLAFNFAQVVNAAVEALKTITGTHKDGRIYFRIPTSPSNELLMSLEKRTQKLKVTKTKVEKLFFCFLCFFSLSRAFFPVFLKKKKKHKSTYR